MASLILLVCTLSAPATAAVPRMEHVRQVVPQVANPVTSCKDTPKLTYNGGPLIQHVKVVDVFYSPGHKYKAMLESYYRAILQSAYFDWLVEYNAPMYKISRGTFASSFEDTNPNPSSVQTVDPQMYLQGLLDANKLPKPDDDTMYMIYFPSGVDPGGSCISNGDYCAYHSSYQTNSGQLIRYGVIPDMEAAGCSMGCGPAGFASFTDVSSHELVEAVTDPDSDAQNNATGWYDPNTTKNNCGEIGDICATGGTGETGQINGYTVQKEWSNKNNDCIVTDPSVMVNDFSLAVAPATLNVPTGGSAVATLTLTKVSGAVENVALTAINLPAGLTATFAPASATSGGGTSMMTVDAAASLMPGTTLQFSVKATGTVVAPTADVNVMIVSPPDMAQRPDLATPDDLSQPASSGGGGAGGGTGGNGAVGGNNGGKSSGCGCTVGGADVGSGWPIAVILLLAFALRRRFA